MNGGTLPGAARSFPTSTAVAALVNGASTAKSAVNSTTFSTANALTALSGAMTANVLKTVVSVSGRGRVNWAGVTMHLDNTSRVMRMKVTIDNAVIVDGSATLATQNTGLVVIGGGAGDFQPVDFSRSLRIEISSSLTETDKLTIGWNYEVWA